MTMYRKENLNFFYHDNYNGSFYMPKAHYHNKHELYFLKRGSCKYFIKDEFFVLEPGNLIFVPKGELHQTDKYDDQLTERFLLIFDDFEEEKFNKYIDILKQKKLIKIPADKLYKIVNIFSKIEHEEKHKSAYFNDLEELLLKQLIVLLLKYKMDTFEAKLTESHLLIQEATKFIASNYTEKLTLETLSTKYSLSKNYFSKLFKDTTGLGVNEFINIIRVSAAEEMLSSHKNISITETAYKCGFNDSNYFAAVFKKIKGITPKKYSSQNK